jgi:hypothetical protein
MPRWASLWPESSLPHVFGMSGSSAWLALLPLLLDDTASRLAIEQRRQAPNSGRSLCPESDRSDRPRPQRRRLALAASTQTTAPVSVTGGARGFGCRKCSGWRVRVGVVSDRRRGAERVARGAAARVAVCLEEPGSAGGCVSWRWRLGWLGGLLDVAGGDEAGDHAEQLAEVAFRET